MSDGPDQTTAVDVSGALWTPPLPSPGTSPAWLALLYLFTTTIHTGVLGALLTFAGRPSPSR
jgi:hypothetical protein